MGIFAVLRDCHAVGVPCSVNIERIAMEKAWEDMKNMLEDIKENGDNEFERNFCYFLLTYMKVVEKQKEKWYNKARAFICSSLWVNIMVNFIVIFGFATLFYLIGYVIDEDRWFYMNAYEFACYCLTLMVILAIVYFYFDSSDY